MTALTDFITDLRTQSFVTSFCQQNVYPLLSPQGIDNCIVYKQITDLTESYYQNSYTIALLSIQLDIFSKRYSQMDTVARAIYSRYHGKVLRLNNTNFSRIVITDNSTLLQTIDENIFRTSMDIDLNYDRS